MDYDYLPFEDIIGKCLKETKFPFLITELALLCMHISEEFCLHLFQASYTMHVLFFRAARFPFKQKYGTCKKRLRNARRREVQQKSFQSKTKWREKSEFITTNQEEEEATGVFC